MFFSRISCKYGSRFPVQNVERMASGREIDETLDVLFSPSSNSNFLDAIVLPGIQEISADL